MVESKAWNWKMVKEDGIDRWKNPSIESYYLVNRWKRFFRFRVWSWKTYNFICTK